MPNTLAFKNSNPEIKSIFNILDFECLMNRIEAMRGDERKGRLNIHYQCITFLEYMKKKKGSNLVNCVLKYHYSQFPSSSSICVLFGDNT